MGFESQEEIQKNYSMIKSSFAEGAGKGKTSSIVTVFAIVNFMVGSAILLIPVNYQNSGIIFSTIAMIVIALINWKTITWLIIVSKGKPDLSKTIRRYLGVFDYRLFAFSCFSIVYGVGIIYFILLNTTGYRIFTTIFAFSDMNPDKYASDKEISFKKFSIQWQAIGIFACMFPLLFLKNLTFLMKLGRVGACSIYSYIILIIYLFADNAHSGTMSEGVKDIKYFTKDIAFILGNFALAFCVHNSIAELMSSNKNQEKNIRDSKFVYMIVTFIYGSIGILGTLALVGRKTSVEKPQQIFDYFVDDPKNIPIFIVALVFFVHLVTVYPLLCFLSRNQLFTLIFEDRDIPKQAKLIFNIVYCILGLTMVILNIDPNIVVGIIGTVFGFVVVYFSPIRLRVKQKEILENDYKDENQHLMHNEHNEQSTLEDHNDKQIQAKLISEYEQDTEIQQQKGLQYNWWNQMKEMGIGHKICFVGLLFIGVSLTVIQFLQIFEVI